MAQTKMYEQLDAVVAPSKVKSIEYNVLNEGRYRVRQCLGPVGGTIHYSKVPTVVTFCHKDAEGNVVPGFQVEQMAIIMRDFLLKQDPVDQEKVDALNAFLGIQEEPESEPAE